MCVMVIMTIIAMLLVALRMYVRLRSERGAGWDDWTIVVALVSPDAHCQLQKSQEADAFKVFAVASCGIGIKYVQSGVGQHIGLVPLQYYSDVAVLSTLNRLPGSVSLTLTRVPICLFLKRFFVTNSRWKWALNSVLALTVLALVSWFCVCFAQCRPVGKIFHRLAEGICWSDAVLADIGYYQGGEKCLPTCALDAG